MPLIKFIDVILTITVLITQTYTAQRDPYSWPIYNPTIDYNFKKDNPNLPVPTKDLNDCSGVAGSKSSGWWTFKWGTDKNTLITDAAIVPMLERLNKDFAYFRDTMGWPPDKRAQDGYRSAVYLYGSGLCTDNAPNTEMGGWQSSIGAYPIILASYYPVYSFDPACKYSDKETQMGALVHEGIHCILASLPGAKQAAWFHEGGNTWLQQQATAQQTGNYESMGFLNGCTFIAPFMPIECYSGWLQDGSFGGPSAEGVDMYNDGKQVCTWRTFLGGTQYGNIFPTFLGEWLGLGSVPWIWKNCPEKILEGISVTLGDEQTRRLIVEYRAKQALIDMKKWSNACKRLLNDNFGRSIGPEWQPYWINCDTWKATPYVKTENDGSGLLTPEQRTTPGWSGANQIPLKVSGGTISVDFQPIGQNMFCQLCYRATDGTPVYSVPVKSGACSLRIDKAPANNVVIAVVCNTDYKYQGESTRKAHYDYRLQLGAGVDGTADIYTKWYNVNLDIPTDVRPVIAHSNKLNTAELSVFFKDHQSFTVGYYLNSSTSVSISIYTPTGVLIKTLSTGHKQAGRHKEMYSAVKLGISSGLYLIKLTTNSDIFIQKINLVRRT